MIENLALKNILDSNPDGAVEIAKKLLILAAWHELYSDEKSFMVEKIQELKLKMWRACDENLTKQDFVKKEATDAVKNSKFADLYFQAMEHMNNRLIKEEEEEEKKKIQDFENLENYIKSLKIYNNFQECVFAPQIYRKEPKRALVYRDFSYFILEDGKNASYLKEFHHLKVDDIENYKNKEVAILELCEEKKCFGKIKILTRKMLIEIQN